MRKEMKMQYQRVELHNHSTESDGKMTAEELMRWAAEQEYGVVALTDHNTCSGQEKAEQAIRREQLPISLLKGVEVTTFYGHILALGMQSMVDFTDLDPAAPEVFLKRLRAEGAAAIGLAHPCCLGRPVTAGCRMDLQIHDWNAIDYIEVFNTSAGTEETAGIIMGNAKALELWEEKVLQGYRLAAVTGKDIHEKPRELPVMITYVLADAEENDAKAALGALLMQKTIVTKGPLMTAEVKENQLHICLDQSSGYCDWKNHWKDVQPVLEIKSRYGVWRYPFCFEGEKQELCLELPLPIETKAKEEKNHAAVLRLYDNTCSMEHLLAAGICVRWKEKEDK